jgi:hypothetical protein
LLPALPEPRLSIGIARPGFSTRCMPGDDPHSYGLHNQGSVWHNKQACAVKASSDVDLSFSVGDTVGIGLLYRPTPNNDEVDNDISSFAGYDGKHEVVLLATRNGQLVALLELPGPQRYPWFPALGMHTYAIAEVNLGQRPFVFDVAYLEHVQDGWNDRYLQPVRDFLSTYEHMYTNTIIQYATSNIIKLPALHSKHVYPLFKNPNLRWRGGHFLCRYTMSEEMLYADDPIMQQRKLMLLKTPAHY